LFVGRLAVEKGLKYLVEAISLCKKDGIELDLTIVGDGDERKALENLIDEQNLGKYVDFKGFVPLGEEMQKIYRQADVFILPSTSEGMPKVLIEALANGLVVIASHVGGIPTLIQNGVNGLLIASRSPSSIADAIQKILMDPATHKKMAQNGLATAMKYTIEERTQHLISQLGDDFSALGWK
jgi:glycosyltransferase involved in cell wall biosynthesis